VPSQEETSSTLFRARIATSALFAANALSLSAWLPRLAEVQQDLALSDVQIGAALSAGAVGGLLAGVWAGPLMNRSSSRAVALVCLVGLIPVLPLLGFADQFALIAIALFFIGALDAVMDAAMNAHSIRIQHLSKRSILNGFHGFWSLGTVLGGIVGVASAAVGLSLGWTLTVVAILVALIGLAPSRWLLRGPDPHSYVDDDSIHERDINSLGNADPSSLSMASTTSRVVLRPIIWALGAFIILAVMIEDIPARWGSIYLTDIGTPAAMAGWGFVAFTTAMTIGRFTGDRIVDALGERRWVQLSMATTAVVLGAGLLISTAWAFIIASAVTGFGVATLFPAAIRAAGHLPGVRPAVGISMVSWLSRAGFVVAPLAVGSIAERFGAAWGIGITVIAAVILVPLSTVLRSEKSH
jgi:MFS family permease